MKLVYPEIFLKNVRENFSQAGEAWLQQLPQWVDELCERWELDFIAAQENLTFGYLCIVKTRFSQKELVLKMSPPGISAEQEANWLRSFVDATPQVYQVDRIRNALLMERLQPGESLKKISLKDDELATREIARSIRKLQSGTSKTAGFKHLSEFSSVFKILNGAVRSDLLTIAHDLFLSQVAPSNKDLLLHGDLHHDNIIKSGQNWKVIDPQGYVGPAVYELGSLFYNPLAFFESDIISLTQIRTLTLKRILVLQEELTFTRSEIIDAAFCRTMLSLAWRREVGQEILPGQRFLAEVLFDLRK